MTSQIIRELIKKKITISTAESCTGGLLASKITSISNASNIFNLGLVTYSNSAKHKILKINPKTLKKYGAVSQQVCRDARGRQGDEGWINFISAYDANTKVTETIFLCIPHALLGNQ